MSRIPTGKKALLFATCQVVVVAFAFALALAFSPSAY